MTSPADPAAEPSTARDSNPLFVLIHGGQQGAWIFDRLVDSLKDRGHQALALDMPAHDANAGAAEYAETIAKSLEHVRDDVVLVGHSMGGLTIPLVPQLRPVRRLVFVCGAYPEPGRSHVEIKLEEPGENVSSGPSAAWEQPGDFHVLPRDAARELFFHDCAPDLQDWALDRLRLQAEKPLREKTPLISWPDVPRSLIIATDDRCIPLDSARRTARRLFDEEPLELPGGHCIPLSQPDLVADALVAGH
jgi:pimeloyl-ACP methyl ester carboxylesterase